MKKFEELKNLAEKAPTVVYDMETESGRFYNAANPQTILALLADRENLREALYLQERRLNHSCNIEYGNNAGIENCLKCKALEALKKSDEVDE